MGWRNGKCFSGIEEYVEMFVKGNRLIEVDCFFCGVLKVLGIVGCWILGKWGCREMKVRG